MRAPLKGNYPVLKLHFCPEDRGVAQHQHELHEKASEGLPSPCAGIWISPKTEAEQLHRGGRKENYIEHKKQARLASSLHEEWTIWPAGEYFLQRRNMPRSFLVKKVKLDDFSSADLESSYGRSRADLSLRFHEKGKGQTYTLLSTQFYV